VFLYHDRKWIEEALSNIIKNAIGHTDINGKIEIGLDIFISINLLWK